MLKICNFLIYINMRNILLIIKIICTISDCWSMEQIYIRAKICSLWDVVYFRIKVFASALNNDVSNYFMLTVRIDNVLRRLRVVVVSIHHVRRFGPYFFSFVSPQDSSCVRIYHLQPFCFAHKSAAARFTVYFV